MADLDLQEDAEVILADIKTVTGLKLPVANGFVRLKQLVGESLKEDYGFYSLSVMLKAVKKFGSELTTGQNKSYGREICLADVHQLMNAYKAELDQANAEVDKMLHSEATEKVLSEEQKENAIRASIQQRYADGDIESCTYADYNQLLKDEAFSHEFINRHGWQSVQLLKHRWNQQIESIPANSDPHSMKGTVEKNELKDKLKVLALIEDEIKGVAANTYLTWAKKNGKESIY